jgi:PleD family two-component response regulator
MRVEALRVPLIDEAGVRSSLTVSIGAATAIARAGGSVKMPEGLLLAADSALYKAKRNGRNRVDSSFLVAPVDMKDALPSGV